MKFLSGPIERPSTLLPQLQKSTQFDYDNVILGLKLIMLGLIKKLVLADNLADGIDVIFSCPQDASGLQLLTATLVYPIQLYADFSGYTDMALGAALLFGIKLSPNFDRPFTATTTADLWRKWHMTLSFWVRDYIFMPMSSILRHWNRPGIYLSLLITFAALGVWHGVGWNFVVYGLIQGVIICYEMRVTCIRKAIVRWCGNTTGNLILMFRTYLLFAFSLIFFRAKSMQDAIYVVRHLSLQIHQSWREMNLGMTDHIWIVCGIAFLLMMIYEYFQSKYNLMHLVTKQPTWVRWSIYYLLIFALLTTGKFDSNDFIYLQF
jgi:D-alanyl-lipoteichoic acid acyltransferase DltB (MBOAT superfamily)